jgi:hypothetical protein
MKGRKPQEKWTDDEHDRLVAFFALLLKVDIRVNPHLYEATKKISTETNHSSE